MATVPMLTLGWSKGVSRPAGEEMDKGIEGSMVAAVLQPHPLLQLGTEGFDAGSFSQQQLVHQWEEGGSSWCSKCQ